MRKIILMGVLVLAVVACEAETEVGEAEVPAATTSPATTDVALDPLADSDWGPYTEWDADANDQLTRQEFDQRFGNVYGEWGGTDATLTADEATDTWRDWFDTNDDDIIDENEWRTGARNFNGRNVNWGEWSAWDADADRRLTEAEWDARFNTVWPANATWSRDEMADTWWDFFDGNDDNIIDGNEWNTAAGYWGEDDV